jgi:hypothetical protein
MLPYVNGRFCEVIRVAARLSEMLRECYVNGWFCDVIGEGCELE